MGQQKTAVLARHAHRWLVGRCVPLTESMGFLRLSTPRTMPRNYLIGDFVKIFSDVLRLRSGIQDIVVDALDERSLPPRRLSPDGVPGMAGDHAHFRG
jgi:hypothetical protein